MRQKLATLVALLIGSVVLSGCDFDVYQLPLPGGTDTGDNPMSVKVEFRDVLDLVPQSNVKVNDVNVGKVSDVELDGYTATVTLELAKDTELPDNAIAEIRQTSLLGEKFVSLSPPAEGASAEPLGSGDVIPLERSGRNPEVEEVLGALSLVLNGGGVAQLKTIASEINLALEGREDSAKSVLTQVESLMTQLDDNRSDIVSAIDSINRLGASARRQQGSIDAALEQLPSALESIDGQREDLVKMLGALNRLGDVGVRVIRASKESTVEAVRQLQPVLTELANSGDAFVDSFNVFLTYPFVDDVVGRDPQVARNLHMGDFTNLSVRLELDLTKPLLPGLPCTMLSNLPGGVSLDDLLDLPNLCAGVSDALTLCANNPNARNCAGIPRRVLNALCRSLDLPLLCSVGNLLGGVGNAGGGGGGLELPNAPDLGVGGVLDGIGLGGLLGRAVFDPGSSAARGAGAGNGPTMEELMKTYDPGLVALLVPPMVVQP
jgi:phospholipid/cholesterol/gamma-HCH transport system substrate-binding protein